MEKGSTLPRHIAMMETPATEMDEIARALLKLATAALEEAPPQPMSEP
jgi:hypothetical protein